MTNLGKLVVKLGALTMLSAMPLLAQIDNAVAFTAPFPFYAGNVKLPAGSYRLTEPNPNTKLVLLTNSSGTRGDFVSFISTSSLSPQKDTTVRFHKYGETGYLRGVSIEGENYGIEFLPTKAEEHAATTAEHANVVEHASLVQGE